MPGTGMNVPIRNTTSAPRTNSRRCLSSGRRSGTGERACLRSAFLPRFVSPRSSRRLLRWRHAPLSSPECREPHTRDSAGLLRTASRTSRSWRPHLPRVAILRSPRHRQAPRARRFGHPCERETCGTGNPNFGQSALKRHLTALESSAHAAAGPGILTLVPSPGGLAQSRRRTPTPAPSRALCADGRLQFVQSHLRVPRPSGDMQPC